MFLLTRLSSQEMIVMVITLLSELKMSKALLSYKKNKVLGDYTSVLIALKRTSKSICDLENVPSGVKNSHVLN